MVLVAGQVVVERNILGRKSISAVHFREEHLHVRVGHNVVAYRHHVEIGNLFVGRTRNGKGLSVFGVRQHRIASTVHALCHLNQDKVVVVKLQDEVVGVGGFQRKHGRV